MSPTSLRALVLLIAVSATASAQRVAPPRYGVGVDVATSIWGDVVPDGPSIGLRGRVALPVNADVSVAGSIGVGAHVFEGTSDARYVLNPQTSLIVTLPGQTSVRYLLGGFGVFVPFSGGGGGPSIHAGAGLAIPLSEASFFVEADPSIVFGEDSVVPVLAVRGGIIF